MSDDDLERLLGEAFDRKARASVGDSRVPPRPRFLDDAPADGLDGAPPPRRWGRIAAPLAAVAAVIAVVTGVLVVSDRPSTRGVAASQTTDAKATAAANPVHVSTAIADGEQVGVGMPIVAYLSRPISDATAFAKATTVTVNGTPVHGAWYFERRSGDTAHPIEADYRMPTYWPGHAAIHVALPVRGLSAGHALAYDNDLSLDFRTGPANMVTVDDRTHRMTVRTDGKVWGVFPVSLGASSTPTRRGIKVIMEKGSDIAMRGPGYYDPHVQWTQRLTYDGEYLHSAPWNIGNIKRGVDSSNGCTNLMPSDAEKLYHFLEVGDVVEYPNAPGAPMSLGAGYGDWNVSWSQWRTGGMYRTS